MSTYVIMFENVNKQCPVYIIKDKEENEAIIEAKEYMNDFCMRTKTLIRTALYLDNGDTYTRIQSIS